MTTNYTLCYRVTGTIESTSSTLSATAREFESATDDAAREAALALREAEQALARARVLVRAATSRQYAKQDSYSAAA